MPVALTEETLASVLSPLSTLEKSLPAGPYLTLEERKRKRRVGESGTSEIAEMATLRLVEAISDARIAQGDPIRREARLAYDAVRQLGQGAFVAGTVGRVEAHRKRDSDEPEA